MKENEKITGDSLADSLNAIILYKKISVIEQMMTDYKKEIDKFVVDIPEFCKAKEDKFETFVNNRINEMIRSNTLDYHYKQALSSHIF